jgi:putative ABC transport system permease protein
MIFDRDKWQEIYFSLNKHKLRTVLTAFGVIWGIFMLVVLMGAGNGLRNGVMRDFDVAKNAVFVWAERTSMPYKGMGTGRQLQLTNDDFEAIKTAVPEVAVVSPRNPMIGNFSVVRKENSVSFAVFGDYPEFSKLKSLLITKGRFLNDLDIQERRKIAVIGKRVLEILFEEDEDPIGEYIKIRGIYFQVVGTFDTQRKGESAMEDAQTIFVPNTTIQSTFNQANRIGYFGLMPTEGVPAATIEHKVKQLLAQRHHVHPDDQAAFGSFNVEKEYKEIQGLFAGINGLSWLVSFMTIIAGVVGVGNIMLIIVKERTKEIGIRKSVGATPFSIISMVVMEALVITSIAGYIGLLAGVGFVKTINYVLVTYNAESQFFANPQIDFHVAGTAILVLVIAGTLAGFIPARKAAMVNPVVALRQE